jgi:hypothetical protein
LALFWIAREQKAADMACDESHGFITVVLMDDLSLRGPFTQLD